MISALDKQPVDVDELELTELNLEGPPGVAGRGYRMVS